VSNVKQCPAGGATLIEVYRKGLCLHLRGSLLPSGVWKLPEGAKQMVVTAPCAGGGDNPSTKAIINQEWQYNSPTLTHVASGMVLAVGSATDITNGAYVTVAPPVKGAQTQQWMWQNFGMIQPQAWQSFSLTDGRAVAGVYGTPVHLWHLDASLPDGAPLAEWQQLCAPAVSVEQYLADQQ
jgi:hypothetical protein